VISAVSVLDMLSALPHSNEFGTEDDKNAQEQLTNAYTFAYSSISLLLETKPGITQVMETVIGLNMSLLEGDPDIGTPWGCRM